MARDYNGVNFKSEDGFEQLEVYNENYLTIEFDPDERRDNIERFCNALSNIIKNCFYNSSTFQYAIIMTPFFKAVQLDSDCDKELILAAEWIVLQTSNYIRRGYSVKANGKTVYSRIKINKN